MTGTELPDAGDTWFVYNLVDSRATSAVRYIGITNAPRRRLASHLSTARRAAEPGHKGAWIRSVLAAGATVEMLIVARGLTQDEASAFEVRAIAEAKSAGARLTNTTLGGFGGQYGAKHSDATRRAIGAASRSRRRTHETRARLSETSRMLGPKSSNHAGFKGVTFDTQRKKWSARITLDGKRRKLGRFETAEDAARAYDAAAVENWGASTFTNFRR